MYNFFMSSQYNPDYITNYEHIYKQKTQYHKWCVHFHSETKSITSIIMKFLSFKLLVSHLPYTCIYIIYIEGNFREVKYSWFSRLQVWPRIFYLQMKRPCLTLPAVQAATTKILSTKWFNHEYLPPENYPLYGIPSYIRIIQGSYGNCVCLTTFLHDHNTSEVPIYLTRLDSRPFSIVNVFHNYTCMNAAWNRGYIYTALLIIQPTKLHVHTIGTHIKRLSRDT